MARNVFYAWQSDTSESHNRYLIRDALKAALKALSSASEVTESPRLDHDTKDVPGTPDVFSTILSKIEECAVFVADVTPVAITAGGKRTPNPNVMLELGYALAKIGDQRILLVLNTVYGAPEDLPFDLARRRWPIRYEIAAEADAKSGAKILGENLRLPLQQVLERARSDDKWGPARKATIIGVARAYFAVVNGLNQIMRLTFDVVHMRRDQSAAVFLEQIGRRVGQLRQTVNTNSAALPPDLLPDVLSLLNSSDEAFRKLRFFAGLFDPTRAEQDLVGTPPFAEIDEIERAIGAIRSAYPDVFSDPSIIPFQPLTAAGLKEVWERAAAVSGRLCWVPEQWVYKGRQPHVLDAHHVRRLRISPGCKELTVFEVG